MQNDEMLAAKSEIEFLVEETMSSYRLARDEGEIDRLHDHNWGMRCDEEDDSILVQDEINDYMDLFLAGYAISIVNSNNRDWDQIYKEIAERDFLQTKGLCEWMVEGVSTYPRVSYSIICIAHLRYKVLEYIEKYLLRDE